MNKICFILLLFFLKGINGYSQVVDTLIKVNNHQLHFKVIQGNGTPILFESGNGDDGSVWEPLLQDIHQQTGATLTYEAVDQITKAGLGQSTCIGIGGDPIIGTTTKDAVELLMNDPETEGIIMIGEIGGSMEADAARWIKENGTKPVVGFIAGQTAPPGRRMGHAGAIIGGADDTAEAKMKIMEECGLYVVASPAELGETMVKALEK